MARNARPANVVSFDVSTLGVPGQAQPVLEALRRRGGRIAWGVIDPVGPEPAGAACLSALTQGLPLDRIAHQSVLTPSCGTGRLSPERERLIAITLDAAARSTRAAIATPSSVHEGSRRGSGRPTSEL